MTIPSTIIGGPSIFQLHLGSGEVVDAVDESDVLVAFYQQSYDAIWEIPTRDRLGA
jgi:2-oxoglutarate ferredoxin oxidoreductase subunit alpha